MTKRPEFPSFKECLKLMRRNSDPQKSEDAFFYLSDRAAEFLPQLIAAYQDESNADLRNWLIELIGDAKSPDALSFLLERMSDENESIRNWAIRGLRQLDIKEARTALWQAGLAAKPSHK